MGEGTDPPSKVFEEISKYLAAGIDEAEITPDGSVQFIEDDKSGKKLLGIPAEAVKPTLKFCRDKFGASIGGDELRELTAVTLVLNPEYTPAWEKRKELCAIDKEAAFSTVVLLRHPKSHEGWRYRGWLHRCGATRVDDELWLTAACAERHPRNYYAWQHRVDVVRRAGIIDGQLRFVRDWVEAHPSDHSALSFAATILGPNPAPEHIAQSEAMLFHLLDRRPDHEGLWNHLRWLATTMWHSHPDKVAALVTESMAKAKEFTLEGLDPLRAREAWTEARYRVSYILYVVRHGPATLALPPDLRGEAADLLSNLLRIGQQHFPEGW